MAKRKLINRQPPRTDIIMHCMAVRAGDELKELLKDPKPWSRDDVSKANNLMHMLISVNKQVSKSISKRMQTKLKQSKQSFEDLTKEE